jgi:hypothetical protein
MACSDYPTAQDAKDFKTNADTINEVVTSDELVTSPAIDGKSKNTLKGLESKYLMSAINGGIWATGIEFTAYNQFMIYNGVAYKPKSTTTLPYTSEATPNVANVEPFSDVNTDNISEYAGGKGNYISNPQCKQLNPDVVPPSATPTDYVPGEEVYLGAFADEAIGIEGLTDIGGLKNATSGKLYFLVPNTGAIADLSTFTASYAGLDLKPKTDGVTFSLDGSNYKIEVDFSVATDVFSVKFETGSVATGHEIETPRQKTFPSISEITSANIGDSIAVDDYYGGATPNNSGVLFFKVVAGGTGIADGGKYIDLPNGFQLEQNLKTKDDVLAWGAMGDGSTDDSDSLDNFAAQHGYIRAIRGRQYLITRQITNVNGGWYGDSMELWSTGPENYGSLILCDTSANPSTPFIIHAREMRNIMIQGTDKAKGIGLSIYNSNPYNFLGWSRYQNVRVRGFDLNVDVGNVFILKMENFISESGGRGMRCEPLSNGGDNGYFTTWQTDGLTIRDNDDYGLRIKT